VNDTMHAGKPYREVVHIEDRRGPRGGPYWLLTLSCGHIVTRRAPNPDPLRVSSTVMFLADEEGVDRYLDSQCAPKKVRCIHCPTETNP